MTPLSPVPAVPGIRTREQLDAVVENIVLLQLEQREILRTQEEEIAAVREKYRLPLVELDSFMQKETAWAEAWARAHPSELNDERRLECPHATIGFRLMSPRVERANRMWTWTAAALKLAETPWGRRYLRIPSPEVNKEAILAEHATLSADELREAGIKIVQGERFFVEAHRQTEEDTHSESNWQEAA